MTNLAIEIEDLSHDQLGWEDVFVILLRRGLVRPCDKKAIRRYVLGLQSKIAKRYGT